MYDRGVHIVPSNIGWSVAIGNDSKDEVGLIAFPTRDRAELFARDQAKQLGYQIFVHGRDGKLRTLLKNNQTPEDN